MNNIYKVIWSKAKNCYVVASEIARSHTKSATGSKKIGGVTRRSLLASLMALSLLCGGLGVAEAAVEVSGATGTVTIYTMDEVDLALAGKGEAKDVAINTAAIADLKKAVGDAGSGLTQEVADQKAAIATNTENLNTNNAAIKSLDGKLANLTTAVADKANEADVNTKLAKKADATSVFTKDEVNTKLTDYAKSDDVYTITAADGKFATSAALTTAKTELDDKIDANTKKITDLQKKTTGLSDDGKSLTDMGKVETDALKVTGQISNGTVTTTLTAINDSITQTGNNKTAIDKLNEKTAEISHAAGGGTNISGVMIKDGNIQGNSSAITGLTNVQTDQINGKSLAGTNVATEKEVKDVADAVKKETDARTEADKALDEKITKNSQNIATLNENGVKYDTDVKDKITLKGVDGTTITRLKEATLSDSSTDAVTGKQLYKTNVELEAETTARTDKDTELEKGIAKNSGDITALDGKIKTNADNIQINKDAIAATDKRTGGITRNDAANETKIEGNVTVDNLGNVTAKGDVNAGSLNVTGASDLKGNVTLGTPNGTNTVTVNGTANFYAAAKMNNDLTVTGDTNLGNTTVTGNLNVTGTITTDNMIFGDKVNSNYTEIDHGKVTSKNHEVIGTGGAGQIISSSSTFNAKENEVGFANTATGGHSSHKQTSDVITDTVKNNNTGDQSFHKQTSDVIMDNVKDGKNSNNRTQTKTETKDIITDENSNSSTTSQTASENKTYLKDKDGKNTNSTIDTAKGYDKTIQGENGKTSTTQDELNITNTAKDGTITNDANHIENKANTMDTNVTGKATESYGSLDTTVNGNETHIVKGTKTETVDGMVTENYKAGQATNVTGNQDIHVTGKQTNTVEGGQINNITGDQTTTITGNKKETVTENVTEDYQKDLTTTVGGNENHEVKGTKTETVEGKLTENFKGGQETNVTGDQTTNVSGTQTINATDINRNASSGMIDTIDNDYGTNKETKVAGKTTTDVSIKGTGEEGKYIRGANESRDYLIKGTLKNSETKTAEATSTEITDGTNKASTIQKVTDLAGSVTNGKETGVSGIHANKDGSVSIDSAVSGEGGSSVINQKKDSITSSVGNADGSISTVIRQDKDNVIIASSNGMVGIVGKDIVNKASENITNTAKNITNEATETLTDKVGENTRVTTSTSITDTVGTANRKIEDGKITDTAGDSTVTTENKKGTTFAKTGSKAYSTKEGAPKDTNIAGNHITTGRVDANELGVSDKDDQGNTADFSVKAGEGIKGSATDKDGNKTSTKVTATENSFQVQDKDGKIKNHQVNTKDSSENTITNGDKTNTVTSTADGTTFNNSGAAARVNGDGTYLNTTIKGNTITTGKVTMDYAEVMKDLGVNRNANIGGKTTTGSLEVKGESKLTGNVTMENNATVGNDLTVKGITTTKTLKVTENAEINGNATIKGDVTAKSYKVGDKTYINADGINANNQKITNVADGSISEGSKDAVNGGQLYSVKNDLEGKVNKVGANAAAMANLHPMEFDPDSKWNIAAAIGNYGSETAAALGAFYRPNDDVMVNLSTAFGTGENMVGGGVSVRLGKGGNKLSREESNALKDQVNDLTARMDALLSVLNPNMSKDFPDVPENHWAYEAVSRLAGNDIVQGYPDGEFHGERTMTRYEMAEIIYNALSRGAEAEKELVEEFKPELQAMAASEKATAERAEG